MATDQTLKQATSEPLFCMFCNVDLMKRSPKDRQSHYEAHLSNLDTLPPPTSGSRTRYSPSHAKSSRTRGISLSSRSVKDQFWYHSLEIEPPSNYTPGLIPLLRRMLLTSVERNTTRRAVLCHERAVHIYHEMWDAGWGCGYRNFMMLCAALMDQRMKPEYSSLIINPIPPGVSNLKVWIEEAWKSGFDPDGAELLNGKLVGYHKWIGTAELYVAFTYRGIPSRLIDFDTPDGNVAPLLEWIKRYFDTQTEDHPTSVQERWRAATPVVISDRMPLILQHQNHSRTIIGYEIAKDGSTTLLTFDPAIRMTQLDIRRTALSSLNLSNQRTGHVSDSKHSGTGRLAESLKKPFQTHSKRAGPSEEGQRDSSPKRLRTAGGPIGDDVLATEDNEKTLDIRKVLKIFRVDQKRLARKKEFQVLWCPMEDPLTESDKQARREFHTTSYCTMHISDYYITLRYIERRDVLQYRCHYYVRIDSTSVRFLRKRNIQTSNCVSKGTFPSFLDEIPTSPHDAFLIPPNGIARRIKVRAPKGIHILIRVIRIRQRYVRLVGHNGRVLGSAQTHRLLLLCKDGLLRSRGTRGGTLEGLGACLRNDSRSVRVAIFQIVDQRATLALARVAFLFFGPTKLVSA